MPPGCYQVSSGRDLGVPGSPINLPRCTLAYFGRTLLPGTVSRVNHVMHLFDCQPYFGHPESSFLFDFNRPFRGVATCTSQTQPYGHYAMSSLVGALSLASPAFRLLWRRPHRLRPPQKKWALPVFPKIPAYTCSPSTRPQAHSLQDTKKRNDEKAIKDALRYL